MSDKISERKPDGGLAEWIEVFEASDNDPTDAEFLMLLIELRARRASAVKLIELPQAYAARFGHPFSGEQKIVLIPDDKGMWLSKFDVEHAIEAAGVVVKPADRHGC